MQVLAKINPLTLSLSLLSEPSFLYSPTCCCLVTITKGYFLEFIYHIFLCNFYFPLDFFSLFVCGTNPFSLCSLSLFLSLALPLRLFLSHALRILGDFSFGGTSKYLFSLFLFGGKQNLMAKTISITILEQHSHYIIAPV